MTPRQSAEQINTPRKDLSFFRGDRRYSLSVIDHSGRNTISPPSTVARA